MGMNINEFEWVYIFISYYADKTYNKGEKQLRSKDTFHNSQYYIYS